MGYNEIVENMLEKFESLQLQGFESIKQMHVKYLEEKLRKGNKEVDQDLIDEIKLMDIERWERSLTDKEKRKIKKRNQDQERVIKRLLESNIGLVDEFEITDSSPHTFPILRSTSGLLLHPQPLNPPALGLNYQFNQPTPPQHPLQIPEFERNNSFGLPSKDSFNRSHKPFFHQGMSHVFLDE